MLSKGFDQGVFDGFDFPQPAASNESLFKRPFAPFLSLIIQGTGESVRVEENGITVIKNTYDKSLSKQISHRNFITSTF